MEGDIPAHETIRLVVTSLRSVRDTNLHSLHSQQLDIRRRQVHCDWAWICDHTHLFQHPVLAVRWSEHILGHEDADHAALCDVDVVDAVPDLLLGYGVVAMHRAVLVQPTSVCVLRLYH